MARSVVGRSPTHIEPIHLFHHGDLMIKVSDMVCGGYVCSATNLWRQGRCIEALKCIFTHSSMQAEPGLNSSCSINTKHSVLTMSVLGLLCLNTENAALPRTKKQPHLQKNNKIK